MVFPFVIRQLAWAARPWFGTDRGAKCRGWVVVAFRDRPIATRTGGAEVTARRTSLSENVKRNRQLGSGFRAIGARFLSPAIFIAMRDGGGWPFAPKESVSERAIPGGNSGAASPTATPARPMTAMLARVARSGRRQSPAL